MACYKLYPCNGTLTPFYSNEPNLSGFVNNYVVLDITSPETLSGECFYVNYYSSGTCVSTTTFTIDYSGSCDCDCICYTFKTPPTPILTEYVNCSDDLLSVYLPTGQTFNICAKTKPVFDYSESIVVKNGGLCVNNFCPKPPITIKPRNECDVLTIFPMEVICDTIHPTTYDSFDGVALLIVTGGTPPYTIQWENGSVAQLINGLNPGEYSAVVSDFYNDFVITSTCVLTGETPTPIMCFSIATEAYGYFWQCSISFTGYYNGKPYYILLEPDCSTPLSVNSGDITFVVWNSSLSRWEVVSAPSIGSIGSGTVCNTNNNPSNYPETNGIYSWVDVAGVIDIAFSVQGTCPTPTPTPLPTYGPLCFRRTVRTEKVGTTIQTQFYPSSYINGYPSWTASPENALMYWATGSTPNYWTISGLTSVGVFKNTDPSIPPLSNWTIQGNPLILSNSIIAYSGICSSGTPITFLADAIAAECKTNGQITINADGGVPAYQYSIDGGATYSTSSVFNNLTSGTYYVRVKDSLGSESSVQSVTITQTPTPSYSLTLSVNQSLGTFTITPSPSLPATETIQFTITQVSTLTYYPNSPAPSPLPSYNNNVTFITPTGLGGMTLIGTQNSVQNINLAGCPSTLQGNVQTKTLTKLLTISGGQTITGSITNQVVNPPNPLIKCQGASGTYSLQISGGKTTICPCCPVDTINPSSVVVRPSGLGSTGFEIEITKNPPKI
jgi:hypothetical protein